MSKKTHIPEPWTIQKCPKREAVTDRRDWPWLISYNDGKYEGHLAIVQTPQAKETAARIVACVNACRGINPKAVPNLLEAAESALQELSFLVDTTGRKGGNYEAARDKLRAAIAKATGGEA
jgi:hypothetical protein